jgi:hypothetical protein
MDDQEESEPQDEGPSPEEHTQRIDVRHLVDEVLNELPAHLRLVLVMSDADEMPMSEIAEVLEIPVGTGYTRLRVARREFASAWKKRCEEQAPHVAALGIAPFLLFDAGALSDVEHETPELRNGFEDQVWNRLANALGPAAGATAGGAAARTAIAHLTATQIAFGVVASALAGAALFALIAALRAEPAHGAVKNVNLPVAMSVQQSSNASPSPLPVLSAAATAPTSSAAAASAPIDAETAERNVLERARASLGRAAIAPSAHVRDLEIAAALAALADHERRFPSASYGQQRDQLRRQILAYQTAHPGEAGGHP